MAHLIIRCTCGQVVRGDDEAALLAAVRAHIGSSHPDLVGRLTDAELLAMVTAA
jgi:hypothetical protein